MTTITKTNHYECNRCKIDSDTKNRLCPCARSTCEAKIVAHKIVTTEYIPATESILKDNTQNKLFKSLKSK